MRVSASLVLLVTVLLGTSRAEGTSLPPTPERMFDSARLPRGAYDLIGYLEYGIPTDFKSTGHYADRFNRSAEWRFLYYGYAIEALGNLYNAEAIDVLRRIAANTLCPVIEADLETQITWNSSIRDPDELRRAREAGRDLLATKAAIAVSRINGESPVNLLGHLAQKWLPPAIEELKRGRSHGPSINLFVEICEGLVAHRSPTAIDAAIAVLRTPEGHEDQRISHLLRIWTGQRFGPYLDTPTTGRAEEVQEWVAWWAVNRNTFDDYWLPKDPPRAMPVPVTLLDHLWIVADYNPEHVQNESLAWLNDNAIFHLRELRALAENTRERDAIRAQALAYYVAHDIASSYPLILEVLRVPAAAHSLYDQALRSAQAHFPGYYRDLLEQCVQSHWHSAPVASRRLEELNEKERAPTSN